MMRMPRYSWQPMLMKELAALAALVALAALALAAPTKRPLQEQQPLQRSPCPETASTPSTA